MPALGVQLEEHFWSGRVHRQFVPIGKILKPVWNECVTPVTCYWSLAVLLHDEDEIMPVFKKVHPPVKMLVPIWKTLCAFTNSDSMSPSVFVDQMIRINMLNKMVLWSPDSTWKQDAIPRRLSSQVTTGCLVLS